NRNLLPLIRDYVNKLLSEVFGERVTSGAVVARHIDANPTRSAIAPEVNPRSRTREDARTVGDASRNLRANNITRLKESQVRRSRAAQACHKSTVHRAVRKL